MHFWFLVLLLLCPAAFGCGDLFKELVKRVHRPAFEWSAAVTGGDPFAVARDKGFVYLAGVMGRKPPVQDREKRNLALRTVDAFFSEAIKGYPEDVQREVRNQYEESATPTFTPKLYENTQNFANWHLQTTEDGKPVFTVEFDTALKNAPLIRKLLLVHEAGVHIGQTGQRLGQVGPEKLMEEYDGKEPYLFTEMSAAAADKTLISAMDFSDIEADAENIPDPVVKLGVLGHLYVTRQMKLHDYVELQHRAEPVPPSAAQVKEFMKR